MLINCSSPCLRSSMKDSSKMPSSPRNGSCRFKAFPGSGGTTILLSRSSSFFSHSKSLYRLLTHDSFNLKIGRFVCCRSSSRCAPRRPCRYRGLAPCGSALRGPGGPPRCGAVSGSGEEPPAAVPVRVGALCAFLASSQLCWKEQSCRRGHGGAAGGFFNSRPRLFAAPLRGAPCK